MNKDESFKEELTNLGERMRKFRKSRGWTLVDLELATGIHDTDLSRIERGLENVEYGTVFKIAMGLGITVSQLTDYAGADPVSSPKKKKP